jgi:hypothetical protein
MLTCALFASFASASSAQQTQDPKEPSPQHHHATSSVVSELFPVREASGTAWLPDETPMYAVEYTWGKWGAMLHGSVFAQYLYETGDIHRTGGFNDHQASSVNWLMVMARRPVRAGRVGLRAMASVEPWTVSNCGFINMLANGEMCEGDTIHDRQHPHDLVMELAADYDRPLAGSLRWQLYAGLAGEPALGPAGFPHRVSAMPNPVAPITHHWLDSSHITYGLITTGLYQPRWKAEISLFNGREPDDNRADLDLGRLDSVSGRLTFAPTSRLAVQVSAGHLHEAEDEFPPEPRSSLERFTASATYHRMTANNVWATTLAYGVNAGPEVIPGAVVDLVTHAGLFESSFTIGDRHTWFGRFEIVGKPGHDLHVHEAPATIFGLAKLQGGYARHVTVFKSVSIGVGVSASVGIVPTALAPRYSGRVAPGFGLFVNVRPARHVM